MIPSSCVFDQSQLAAQLEHDPLIQEYRAFFALLDWPLVQQWQAQKSRRGRPSHPESAYLKAFLIRIKEGFQYARELRDYLLTHPLLVIELGFTLILDPQAPYGFDVERTVPTRQWWSEKLRHLDRGLLTDLLVSTVQALKEEIPGLGEVVAFDVKHIYAWVKENNARASVRDRYDKTRIPAGDPDCRLGVKRSTNQEQPDGSTEEKKELLWGYGSPGSRLLPPPMTAMSCWRSTRSPSMKLTSPPSALCTGRRWPPSMLSRPIWPLMRPLMPGMSTSKPLAMMGSRRSRSMRIPATPSATPMVYRCVPSACACIRPTPLLTLTAIGRTSIAVHGSLLGLRESGATMRHSRKGSAVSGTSISRPGA